MIQKIKILTVLVVALMTAGAMYGQTATPKISFYSTEENAFVEIGQGETKTVQAPCNITCTGNVEYDASEYDRVICEWKIFKENEGESHPFLDRYEQDAAYTLTESGGYGAKFYATFINTANNDTVEYEMDDQISLVISESKLTCTDGLSPNDDGINDELKIECQSLVKVEGYIMNRWGKVLHTFNVQNISDGWNGKVNGKPVKDGAYLLYIDAVGSDGLHYKIKKAINVMKGLREDADSGSVTGN